MFFRSVLLAVLGCALAGCSTFMRPEVEFAQPATVRPAEPPRDLPPTGAIYQANGGNYRPLFEDKRARYVGDIITVAINEKTQAASKQGTNANRTSSTSADLPAIKGLLGKNINGLSATTSTDSSFAGKGDASADNLFTGTITVTVIDVLANGNLVVSGEKQLGIGQNMETLRFSGVVDPSTIRSGNVVSSAQIADARIQTRGQGAIDQAQTVGWLSRFFMSYWPF